MLRLAPSLLAIACLTLLYVPSARAEDLQEEMVKMLERQAQDISTHAPDCDKVAAALSKHVAADTALTKKVVESDKGKTKEQKKAERDAFGKKYGERMKAASQKMAGLKACKDNAKVKEWKKALDAATDPRK